jgi:hypothetical protein
MRNAVSAKAGKRLLILLALIVCLLYVRPQKASAFAPNCTTECEEEGQKCAEACRGISSCVERCDEEVTRCLAGCG